MKKAKLTILFDNEPSEEGFPTLWGFSAYIETGRYTLLFDTGSNGRVLLQNMRRLGKDPRNAQALFLSHPHWDHIGGLDSILENAPQLRLFLPDSFSKHLIRDLKRVAKEVVTIDDRPRELLPDLFSTGTMRGENGPGEHAAVFDTPDGAVLITGCAHPGIVPICERAKQITGKKIKLLVGGFHLMYENEKRIAEVIQRLRKLGVEEVCPTHCSGDLAIEMFEETFKERFIRGGVGRIIEF